ncbi:MAG: nicotinate-nucleotide adenylyltransferase [Gammaproteobacteria bacterium]|nr:nicotinate-nucleotide adenylyltransferase [Gammaproteobacteria bacterium]
MIGILGGAFDPVHFGHLRPALELHEALALDTLLWIPTGQAAHRESARASGEQRVAMLQRAINGVHGWQVDRRELRRSGPAYMIDTLRELRTEQGTDTPLCLLMGMDAFAGLPSWHEWQQLFELAHLVVSHRPGISLDELTKEAPLGAQISQRQVGEASLLKQSPAGRIYFHPLSQLEISSTRIRELLAAGQDPRYLLPEKVLEFIRSNDLYKT